MTGCALRSLAVTKSELECFKTREVAKGSGAVSSFAWGLGDPVLETGVDGFGDGGSDFGWETSTSDDDRLGNGGLSWLL